MKHLTHLIVALCLAIALPASAQDKADTDWEAAYKKLMSNPEARAEIEAKGASKEEVIAWLKEKAGKGDADKEKMVDAAKKDVDWDAAYAKLLKERPDVAQKIQSGGATKEQVIAWMKGMRGGDKGGKGAEGKGKGKAYGRHVDVKNPRGFKQEGETTVFSGPQPGEKLPSFKVIGLHGKRKGQEYDPTKVAGGKPMVLIFQDNQVPGQKGLLLNGEVFTEIAKRSNRGLDVFSVFLVDDPTPENVFEYDFKDRIPPVVQMSISKDRRDGPGSYGLNRNLGMTIIVARDGKVLHNFPMAQPLLYPNAYVLGAIAEAVDVKPEAMAAWFAGGNAGGEMMAMKAQDKGKKRDGQKGDSAKGSQDKPKEEVAKMDRRRPAQGNRRGRVMEVKDPAGFAKTQEKPVFSGPQKGEKLPAFKATSLVADQNGKQIDIIKDAGDAPQVLVFQDRQGVGVRGLYGLSAAVNKVRQKHKNLKMSVVFLDDDAEYMTQFAGRFASSLKQRGMSHITISPDGRDGPGNYGLNRNISQTIILAKGGKVTHNFTFPRGILYADAHVLGGLAELVGEKFEALAKIVNTPDEREKAMTMRRQSDPADPQADAKSAFRAKLGNMVRNGKITRAEAGELWKAAFGDAAATARPGRERERDTQRDQRPKRDK